MAAAHTAALCFWEGGAHPSIAGSRAPSHRCRALSSSYVMCNRNQAPGSPCTFRPRMPIATFSLYLLLPALPLSLSPHSVSTDAHHHLLSPYDAPCSSSLSVHSVSTAATRLVNTVPPRSCTPALARLNSTATNYSISQLRAQRPIKPKFSQKREEEKTRIVVTIV